MRKKRTFSMVFRIISLNKRYYLCYILLLIASLFVASCGVIWSESFRRMVNGAASGNLEAIYSGFVLAIIIFFLDSTVQLLSSYYGNKLDNVATIRMQKYAMDCLLHAKISIITKRDSNYYASVINQYIPTIQQTANKKIRDVLGMIVTLVVTIAYLLQIDIALTIGVVAVSTVLPLSINLFSKRISKQHDDLKNMALDRDAFIQDVTQAPIEIREFNLGEYFLSKLKKINNAIFESGHSLFRFESALNRINSISNYLCILLILFYGGFRVYNGYIELGDIVAFLYSSARIFNPLPAIVSSWLSIQSTLVKAKDVFDILDFEQEEKKENKFIYKCDVSVRNLSFSYGGKNVLRNVSAVFEKGKITALVGPNGAGKSTLVKIILGLYAPTEGDVTFDADDIKTINSRQLISYVSQRASVFSMSIKENILLGDNSDSIIKEKMSYAIECAALKKFINEHDGGIEYVLRENGSNVSGGELQRICVARAFIRDKPILILDEHTSNIDGINEETIFESIKNNFENKTIIVIAHKVETMKKADKIIYMGDGEIKGVGSFNELLTGNDDFREFING